MAHWRDTMKPAKFFTVDAKSSIPLLFFLCHIAWWTFGIALSTMVFFYIAQRKGLTFESSLRAVRLFFVGDYRPALPKWKIRGPIDYDRRNQSVENKKRVKYDFK